MGLLEIHQLEKGFFTPEGRHQKILDIRSFSMNSGQQLGLRGQSGSGKTTFLHMIAGIIQPDAGQILLDGHPMHALSEARRDQVRASTVGYIFQTFNLLAGFTCLENVHLGMRFGSQQNPERAVSLLEQVGLQDRMHYRPSQLSVGQQQRVAIARALANSPRLVLADEPTGNLDPSLAEEALSLIRTLCTENNAALLLVSHDQGILDQFQPCLDLREINRASQGGGS